MTWMRFGIDVRIGAEDVCLGALGDGDDCVGIEDGRALHPGAHGVAAAELLGLPGAQRFQRVGGENKGHAVEFFGEVAGHRYVPGMGVDDVDALSALTCVRLRLKASRAPLNLPSVPLVISAQGSAPRTCRLPWSECCGPQQCTSTSISRASSRLR